MKKTILNLLLLLILYSTSFAQRNDSLSVTDTTKSKTNFFIDDRKSFVYLEKDSVIYGHDVIPDRDIFGRIKGIHINNVFYKQNQVRFVNIADDGLYGYIKQVKTFVPRSETGKLNIYSVVVTSASSSGVISSSVHYYNKGYDRIKIANYHNLIDDVKDNPYALKQLEKTKTTTVVMTLLCVFAVPITIMGLYQASDNSVPVLCVLGGISYAVGMGSLVFLRPSMLSKVVRIYNK